MTLNADADLRDLFYELKRVWHSEITNVSSMSRLVAHPAYREIVAMGSAVVPIILADLERKPDWWFSALREITGANPVPVQARGKIKEMAEAWLQWGRENNVHC